MNDKAKRKAERAADDEVQAVIMASYEQSLAGAEEVDPKFLIEVQAHVMMADIDVTGQGRKPATDDQYRLIAARLIDRVIGPERLKACMEGMDIARAQAKESEQNQAEPEWPRLSVNLNDDVAAVLRARMVKDRINATEAVRRAISVWDFCMDHQMVVDNGDGTLSEVEGLGVRGGLNTRARRGSWWKRWKR